MSVYTKEFFAAKGIESFVAKNFADKSEFGYVAAGVEVSVREIDDEKCELVLTLAPTESATAHERILNSHYLRGTVYLPHLGNTSSIMIDLCKNHDNPTESILAIFPDADVRVIDGNRDPRKIESYR